MGGDSTHMVAPGNIAAKNPLLELNDQVIIFCVIQHNLIMILVRRKGHNTLGINGLMIVLHRDPCHRCLRVTVMDKEKN